MSTLNRFMAVARLLKAQNGQRTNGYGKYHKKFDKLVLLEIIATTIHRTESKGLY